MLEWKEFVLLKTLSLPQHHIVFKSGDVILAERAEYRNNNWYIQVTGVGPCVFPVGTVLPWFCEYHYSEKEKMRMVFLIETHLQEILKLAEDPGTVQRPDLLYLAILRITEIIKSLSSLLLSS